MATTKKRTFVFILFLAATLVIVTQFIDFAAANFKPSPLPAIRILSDGTISPSTSLITRDGSLYTLMSNSSSYVISVECSNIELDGSGFFIIGNGWGTELTLLNVNNVTIHNFNMIDCLVGILLNASLGITIEENSIEADNYGIELTNSANNLISNNNLTNCYCGIKLMNSGTNTLRSNTISENDPNAFGLYFLVTGSAIDHFVNDIDSSNHINGRTICYWVNRQNAIVPQDQAYIALVNCRNITVHNQNIHHSQAILLAWTNYSTVTNCASHFNYNGIQLISSTGNLIGDNLSWGNINLDSGGGDGISLLDSNSNKVVNNLISANWGGGITLAASSENQIIGNNVTQNWNNGINLLAQSNTNTISQNRLYNHTSQSHAALFVQDSKNNTITANNINDNYCFGMQFLGSQQNNVLYHNNFIDNAPSSPGYSRLQVSMPGIDDQHPTANKDDWDNGFEGNYWSDYKTRYPNAAGNSDQGIGDAPYVINDENVDRFPLWIPFQIPTTSTSLYTPNPPPATTQSPSSPPNSPTPSHSSTTTQPNSGFLGMSLPTEYGYAIVAVLVIAVVAGVSLFYLRRARKG